MLCNPGTPALIKHRSSLHEPRMGASPNRISSPFGTAKTPASYLRLTQSAQVNGVTRYRAPEPVTARHKLQCAKSVPPQTLLEPGPPHARERIRRPLVTHPRNRKDNPMNDPTAKTTAGWQGIEETAGLLNLRIAEWHDFGYVTPPAPTCKTIPPLGKRSAEAIKAGHGAIEVIDEIVRDLHRLRDQLVGELRTDEGIRAVRLDAMLAEYQGFPERYPSGAQSLLTPDVSMPNEARRSDVPEPTPLIHMEKSASATVCGLPTYQPPIHLGVLTVDPAEVTCPACQPKHYWQEPAEAVPVGVPGRNAHQARRTSPGA